MFSPLGLCVACDLARPVGHGWHALLFDLLLVGVDVVGDEPRPGVS